MSWEISPPCLILLGYRGRKREETVTWQERYMPTPNLSSLLCTQSKSTVSMLVARSTFWQNATGHF